MQKSKISKVKSCKNLLHTKWTQIATTYIKAQLVYTVKEVQVGELTLSGEMKKDKSAGGSKSTPATVYQINQDTCPVKQQNAMEKY